MAATYQTNLSRLKGQAAQRSHIATVRKFGRSLSPPQPGRVGAPPPPVIRWATVTSVNGDGTVGLLLDGGPLSEIPCATTYSPVVGDDVICRFLGGDLYVEGTIGGFSAGELVAHGFGPGTTTAYTTNAAAITLTAAVMGGASYMMSGRVLGSQITNAGGIAHINGSTDDGLVSAVRFWDTTGVPISASGGGGGSTIYVPTADRTTTFTLNVFSSVASFQVAAGQAELIVLRVG